jgi:OmpA-OmpF porin, OOP family
MSNLKTPLNSTHKTLLQSALLAVFAVVAFTPAVSMAQTKTDPGNWHNPTGTVWKNSTGLCWRSGSWIPANGAAECDPDLMAKAEPAAAPAPKMAEALPPVQAAPPAPTPVTVMQSRKISFSAEELFDFDKSTLRPAGKASLDKLASGIGSASYDSVQITGHTDRIGTKPYNQKLSERRAQSVHAYLVSKGVHDGRTTSVGMGETQPVTKLDDCKGPVSKKLITCLQPDRRVDVEVKGSKEVAVSAAQ